MPLPRHLVSRPVRLGVHSARVEGFFPIFFLAVILKIPVGLMLYLVWWAVRASDAPAEAPPETDDHRFRRFRRDPRKPRGPRRGPHAPDAQPLPACPPGGRFRVVTAPAPLRTASARAEQRGSADPTQV
jgi:hypothetical protein